MFANMGTITHVCMTATLLFMFSEVGFLISKAFSMRFAYGCLTGECIFMFDITGTYTDLYQLAMAQVYFLKGQKGRMAVFDYFFRKLPYGGGYAVFAGLETLLDILENLRFDQQDGDFLATQGLHPDFVAALLNFRFTGTVYSMQEGEVVFPTQPVVTIEADIIQAQIIETVLLNMLNLQTLIATKASRMRWAAGDKKLVDFGLRRAQATGGHYASRAAIIGGFDATSNVRAGRDFNLPVSGTMAHSFVQSHDDELAAFRNFAEGRPEDCVLLVDTYDTLKSGVPNAIKVAGEMEKQGQRLKGIRLDSGDLAYLAKKARHMLDQAGLPFVKIAVSNQLDEYVIKSLVAQQAPIDLFGVGTRLVTGQPDAALDGVYKLAALDNKPRIKLSETPAKTTVPHLKKVFRVMGDENLFLGADAMALAHEKDVATMHHPFEPSKHLDIAGRVKESLMEKVMENGQRTVKPVSVAKAANFRAFRLKQLPGEYQRFENPHVYKVGLSSLLKKERDVLIEKYRLDNK